MTRCVTTKGEALLSRGISHSDTALKRSELLQHHGVLVLHVYLADVPCDSWKSNKGAPEFLLRLLVPRYASSKPKSSLLAGRNKVQQFGQSACLRYNLPKDFSGK